jgi:hypothetical protein
MGALQAALEEYLASMPDDEWEALTARVRPPYFPIDLCPLPQR